MSGGIMIMAGGTGGHVFPALAVAERCAAHGIAVIWMGTQAGLEAKLVPSAGILLEKISVTGLRGKGLMRLLIAPFMLLKAVLQAGLILWRQRPQVVLGMGGFASGPGGLAARCLRIPLVVHEQNAIAGLTNRYLARIANQVLQAFPDCFPSTATALTVGNPVRADIAALPPPGERFTQRDVGEPLRLLVLGGSQGALALNKLVPQALAQLSNDTPLQVWHQTGERLLETAQAAYQDHNIEGRIEPFINDMATAYGWADLVLCRSGALTVAELAAAGVGAILVPFPFAVDDHQTANGRFLQQTGAARIIAQDALSAASLAALLRELAHDRPRLLQMAQAARSLAQADVAERIAMICLQQAGLAEGTSS